MRASASLCGCGAVLLAASAFAPGLPAAEGETTSERSEAYYHFAVGHLYHQFVKQFGRAEYVDRATKEYEQALERDPGSVEIRLEMMDLFAGTRRLPRAVSLADEILADDPNNVAVRRLLGNIYRSFYADTQRTPNREYLLKAIEQFERLVEIEPDEASNHLELGRMQGLAEDYDAAAATLRRALELDSEQSAARANLAYILLEAGKLEEAIKELEQVVADGPSSLQHINTLANSYEQIGRAEDAAKLYERLLKEGGNSLEARQRLADNLFRSGQFGKALEHYKTLAGLDPQGAETFVRIAAIERARGNIADAWEALERARQIDPDSLQVQFEAVNLLGAEGKADEAIKQLRELLDATRKDEYPPNDLQRRLILLQRLGSLQQNENDPAAAVRTFREIISLQPGLKARVWIEIVETWRRARDYQRAEQEARDAADEFKDDPVLATLLANILSDRGKTKEAVKAAQRMAKVGVEKLDVLLTVARIYEKARQFDRAKQQIDEASELADSDDARIGVLFAYGSMHERAKDYEQAEAKFRELLAAAPDNSSALNYLGYMFADRGMHLNEAHDMIQRALDLEPNNGAYLDSLGWVYFRQNKLELAAKFLERSLEQYKDDPVVHSHLGDVYFKQGRIADAKRHWNRGLEEWNRSAPADRDPNEVESLRRKLAELEMSMADEEPGSKTKNSVKR